MLSMVLQCFKLKIPKKKQSLGTSALRHFAAPLEELPAIVAQGGATCPTFSSPTSQLTLCSASMQFSGDATDWNQMSTSQQRDSVEVGHSVHEV